LAATGVFDDRISDDIAIFAAGRWRRRERALPFGQRCWHISGDMRAVAARFILLTGGSALALTPLRASYGVVGMTRW